MKRKWEPIDLAGVMEGDEVKYRVKDGYNTVTTKGVVTDVIYYVEKKEIAIGCNYYEPANLPSGTTWKLFRKVKK